MIGNYDIEVAFLQANLQLNEQINKAQQQFYKTEIDRQQEMMKMRSKNMNMNMTIGNNPLLPSR